MRIKRFVPTLLFLGLCVASSFASPDSKPALQPAGGEGGAVHLVTQDTSVCTFKAFVAALDWRHQYPRPLPSNDVSFTYIIDSKPPITGNLRIRGQESGVQAEWYFHAQEETRFSSLVVATSFGGTELIGGSWKTGAFPETFSLARLFNGKSTKFTFQFPDKRSLDFTFAEPTTVLVQDNRQWGDPTFTLRFGYGGNSLAAGQSYTLSARITASGGLSYARELPEFLRPVEVREGTDWVPLRTELEIEAGSALDLSGMGFTAGPCGARIVATADGNFAEAQAPDKPLRFYGVNLSYTSNYLEKNECDRLLDRLVRLGYNTVRIHHHEKSLSTAKDGTGFDWDPVKVDQLDYLIAGCKKRGLWVTTDLFVSRPVAGAQIGRKEPLVGMALYKLLVPVSEPAYADWRKFSSQFLDHVNPYTLVRLAEEPTIAWLSLVNEGPISNNWGEARTLPEWKTAWNSWLEAAGAGVRIEDVTTPASVFVSSLENAPIRASRRLLVTHLTDLQNTGARYAEKARQTLLAYGDLPHLVRDGQATVAISLDDPGTYTVYGLSLSGKRGEEVPAKVSGGQLVFTATVRGPSGARMLYEVTNERKR
jgi:hypothetical protein